jgi:hypothetical protein
LEYHKVRENFLSDILFSNPNATKEKIEALTLKRMRQHRELEQRRQNGSPELNDLELTLRPDLSKTLRRNPKLERGYYHSGKWEKQPYEESEAWSCCMNNIKESEGCVAYRKENTKWNVTGF